MTTDSFVVKPLRFPGGSIGELAVNGTVNDLAMAGARPVALTLSLILEEGLDARGAAGGGRGDRRRPPRAAGVRDHLRRHEGRRARHVRPDVHLHDRASASATRARRCRRTRCGPGDVLLVSGPIGAHGTAIMLARGEFDLDADISSDTRCLWPAVDALLGDAGPQLRCLRDATRGGVASVLNELARASGVAMLIREAAVPVAPAVAGAAEILGIDPMHVANEGVFVAAVAPAGRGRARSQALRRRTGRRAGRGDRGRAGRSRRGWSWWRRRSVAEGSWTSWSAIPCRASVDEGDVMASVEFSPNQAKTEAITAHVLWMTVGLSCEGDSVAMTSATNPSLEDIITGAIPGMPKVVVHNQVLAYEYGEDYMQAWYDAEEGKLDPFVLIVEGSLGNEKINGDGYWTGFGVNRTTGQPITTNEWVDRLSPKAAAVVAIGTCATYGGIPAMKNNPTGAMGVRDYLGWKLEVEGRHPDRQHPRLPGPAGQHDRDADAPRLRARGDGAGARARRGRAVPSACSAAPRTRAATAPRSTRWATSPPSTGPITAAW